MKSEEITIKIGHWLMDQASKQNPEAVNDIDPATLRNLDAMNMAEKQSKDNIDAQRTECAKALGMEDNAEFQAFFKIVYQLWQTGRLDMIIEYWQNKEILDNLGQQ